MRFTTCLLLLTIFSITALAQTKPKPTKKAVKFYQKAIEKYTMEQYEVTVKYLKKAIKKSPTYLGAYVKLAEVHERQENTELAKKVYEQLLEVDESPQNAFSVYRNLARLAYAADDYKTTNQYLKQALALTLPDSPAWKKRKKRAERFLANSEFALAATNNPVPFDPNRMDETVNSKHDEYLPMLTADEETLVFTRRFRGDTSSNEDFYASKQDTSIGWEMATALESPINTPSNEGAICISPDGKRLFFAAKDRKDRDALGGFDIYYCVKRGNNWSKPYNLGHPVNTTKWDSQPSISADGKSLYFSSRRKGGKGGTDIWVSHLKDNYWTTPINLGENINTKGNEQSPFIHPDNQTLYFSSDGHIGMGDADLYVVRKDENGDWGQPENLGYPINTKGNENGLIVTADGQKAYFSSYADSMGLDLYYFNLPPKARPIYVTYVKGKVYDASNKKELAATIELIDLETGKTVLKTISDAVNGQFLVTLPIGKNYMYNVAKNGYLFHSENFSLSAHNPKKPYLLDVPLDPIVIEPTIATITKKETKIETTKPKPESKESKPAPKTIVNVGKTVILKNVFFETNDYELKQVSEPELNRLVQLLKEQAALRIEISGHTDSIGKDDYNQRLSENRAKSVYSYLINKGIANQRLTYKGYGERNPIAPNKTEEGRAKNRRTEFKIIGNDFESQQPSGSSKNGLEELGKISTPFKE